MSQYGPNAPSSSAQSASSPEGFFRHPMTAAMIGVVGTLIAAFIGLLGASKAEIITVTAGPQPTTTVTTNAPGPTVTVTQTAPPNSQSPTETGPSSPAYLTELDYSTNDSDDYVEVGLASIAGKRYKKSFRVAECMSPEITVVLPSGNSQLSGVVGYDDESGSKDGSYKVQIEATSDADPAGEDVRFTRLDVLTIPSGGRRAVPFSEDLPPGTTGIRLSAVHYACSTTVSWGDPKVS
jgi:hypothetical protein